MNPVSLMKWMRFWPPYWGAGIRVTHVNEALTHLEVEMRLTRFNRNYVGTHFGGSLYSMVDPFYMLMLMQSLGRDYIIWDKAATIQFKKTGRGRVVATFDLSPQKIAEIREAADSGGKVEPVFNVEIKNDVGEIIALVEKVLYVRRKPA